MQSKTFLAAFYALPWCPNSNSNSHSALALAHSGASVSTSELAEHFGNCFRLLCLFGSFIVCQLLSKGVREQSLTRNSLLVEGLFFWLLCLCLLGHFPRSFISVSISITPRERCGSFCRDIAQTICICNGFSYFTSSPFL